MNRERLLEISRFLRVGVANTLLGLSIIYAAKWLFQISDIPANALGYSAGLTLSFFLNSHWTFRYKGPRGAALVKFALVSLFAYGMNLLAVMGTIRYFGLNSYVAQATGIGLYTGTSYFASKYLVFRGER